MTTKKKRTRAAAGEPTATTRKTKVAKADRAPVDEPPRTEPGRAEAPQPSSTLTPEMPVSGAPPVNGTEIPAPTEASVATAATAPAWSPEQPVSPANKLSALEAAAKVLAETGQAMSCAELITAMAANGYWSSPKGRTPAGTLSAAVLREMKTRGEKARFCKTGRGQFALKNVR
jgi:hypothetical protein